MNSAHFDVNDTSRCISTFTEQKVGEASCWYFILPNVAINWKWGIAIELHHGVTISWDRRVIWHCSSISDVKSDNSVHGSFVAAWQKQVFLEKVHEKNYLRINIYFNFYFSKSSLSETTALAGNSLTALQRRISCACIILIDTMCFFLAPNTWCVYPCPQKHLPEFPPEAIWAHTSLHGYPPCIGWYSTWTFALHSGQHYSFFLAKKCEFTGITKKCACQISSLPKIGHQFFSS